MKSAVTGAADAPCEAASSVTRATAAAGVLDTLSADRGSRRRFRPTLAVRAGIVLAVLAAEKFLLNFMVDFAAAQAAQGFGATVRIAQHWGFRFIVTLAGCIALLGYVRAGEPIRQVNRETRDVPLRARWAILHLLIALALVPLSYSLYGHDAVGLPFAAVVALWIALALAASIALFAAMAPWSLWRRAGESLGVTWLYAFLAAAGGVLVMAWSQMLWQPTARITFHLVRYLLEPLLPALQADPSTLIFETDRFAVQVSDECSGLEGIGLMLVFCAVWLLCFRREYVFPRALLLVPVGVALIFALNILRLGALVLIGHYVGSDIAIYGFHSQAGWIAFNGTAGTLAYVSRQSPWLNRAARHNELAESQGARHFENPTAVYLLPLLALLAAGMISRASSGTFESAYFIRLPVALLALAYTLPRLTDVDWRFSWRAVAIGSAVFAIWLLAARLLLPASAGMPSALAALSPLARTAWIAVRIATSVLVVPLAEELAYRGFLLRRMIASDFESVKFGEVGLWPLLISAVLFGAVHGAFWAPGIIAGVLYGLLAMRTGRLGEAIVAHGVTNALIAATVLSAGQWRLW